MAITAKIASKITKIVTLSAEVGPMVDKRALLKTSEHFNFHIDDHFEWWQGGRYYAIVKDHDAPFMTPHGRNLVVLQSPDAVNCSPSCHMLVKDFSITWSDGTRHEFERLEMPKLLFEEKRPKILSLRAKPVKVQDSFLVIIPLRQEQRTGSAK